jgi:hypothetical protein
MSVAGKWKYDGEVSDQSESHSSSSLTMQASIFNDVEFTDDLELQLSFSQYPVETIVLSLFWDGQLLKSESYDIANLNIFSAISDESDESCPSFGFNLIQNCDKDLTAFGILRLGPNAGEGG